jgi:hypothetical protein
MKKSNSEYLKPGDIIELGVGYNPQRQKTDFKPVFMEVDLILGRYSSMRIFKSTVYLQLNEGERWQVMVKRVDYSAGKYTRDGRRMIIIEVEAIGRIEEVNWTCIPASEVAFKQFLSGEYEISCESKKLTVKEVAYRKAGKVIIIEEYYVEGEMVDRAEKRRLSPAEYIEYLRTKSGMKNLIVQPRKFIRQLAEYPGEV